MARTQTMVQLTAELVAQLDEEAARLGVSRSAVIRTALDAYLRQVREESVGAQIAAGYRRIPPATPDAWGDPTALSDAAARELLLRLDEEERQQGDTW